MKRLLLACLVCLVAACGQPAPKDNLSPPSPQGESGEGGEKSFLPLRYAKGFTVERFSDYTLVEIKDPWDGGKLLQRYVLLDRSRPAPSRLPKGTLIRTPLQNVAVFTSVHVSIIEQLGEAERIAGVCEPQYITSPAVHEQLRTGKIADLGMAASPNIEKIMDTGVEYIIASPLRNAGYGQMGKMGVPVIEAADYMEALPLGRAEWGRFYGLLFDRQAKADSLFRETEENYLALQALALKAAFRPAVLPEKRYGSFWYVPGNESYMAWFFKHAGADYLFQDISGAGSVPLSFETVLDRAVHADYWLIKYNQAGKLTYDELRSEYPPYEHFDAFQNRSVYICNTGETPYYEEVPIRPDYLLKDLIRIFHPELLPDHILRYYEKMP